jgi:hypothetical protein
VWLALVYVVTMADVDTAAVVTLVADEEVAEEELVLLPLPIWRLPPAGPPGGAVDCVALEARRMNASRVLPVDGALMAPTMPF